MMRYIYQRVSTNGTTGYVRCNPADDLPISQALALLEQRPLDTFLHKYALGLLLAEKDLAPFINHAAESPLLSALLAEARALGRPDIPDIFSPRAQGENPQGLPEELTAKAVANIHRHEALPEDFSELCQSREAFQAKPGSRGRKLAEIFEGWSRKGEEEMQDEKELPGEILNILQNVGLEPGQEMRHEASLAPIALLRNFTIRGGVVSGRNTHVLEGTATAYGRGLKLVHARIGCLMEIVERISAHKLLDPDKFAFGACSEMGEKAILPGLTQCDTPLHWVEGQNAPGERILVPAQAVYLFANLDEANIFEHIGSTGLGSGMTPESAKLSALLEVIERDSHATMPFLPSHCFELYSNDPVIGSLLADYRWRGIKIQFQDITTELGVPCYRCFVHDKRGNVAQATAASLSGKRAALAALTETPWPYSWATPVPAPSGAGLPNLPGFLLEGLPDYSQPSPADSLALLESTLMACGLMPVYVDLTRPDLGIPVYRAFVVGLENDVELEKGISLRFIAHL